MATNYGSKVMNTDRAILQSAITILNRVLGPYRADVLVERRFLWISIKLTVGDVLDFLTQNFA